MLGCWYVLVDVGEGLLPNGKGTGGEEEVGVEDGAAEEEGAGGACWLWGGGLEEPGLTVPPTEPMDCQFPDWSLYLY
jgi:hypothetical protein